jgi:hypothetical protein
MIQRLMGPGGPNMQDASQRAVAGSFGWSAVMYEFAELKWMTIEPSDRGGSA